MVTVVVLLSFVLVLAAAVTLVIGLLNSGLGLIYVSIGCSVAAGIVLALAVVRNRPREGVATTSVGTERLRALETDVEPTVTVVSPRSAGDEDEADELDVEPARARAGGNGEGLFPIADYDELKVGEIVALLPELDPDELEMVREREASGKNRSTILTRVEALTEAAHASGWGVGERQWEDWGEGDAQADDDDEGVFPIADYDELKVAEIVPLLPELDPDELEMVREREQRGANRATILSRIDNLLAGEEEAPPPKRAPAKKSAAKKTATKRAPAKKTAVKKTATKRAPAKKTAAKKTAKKTSGARKR